MLTSLSVGLCEWNLFDGDNTNDGVVAKRTLGKTVLFVAAAVETLGNGASTDSSVTRGPALSMLVEQITGRGIRTKMEVKGTAVILIWQVF